MAKLPRKTQKIFCSKPTLENQTSVFGTMKTADKQYSTDVGTLQSNAAYEQGWKSATIASYKPFMEDFNTLNYINTSQLAYLFQQGIPEWDESTAYYKNSFCSYNGDLWKSLIDDNLNNTPLEGESWTLFTSGKKSGSGLELCDIGMALYIDETKGLRRYLNGQIVDINTNTQAFLNRLKDITTLHPSLLCTEEEWQTAKTMSVFGQVGKFVFNYSGDEIVSVRLPRVVNVQGVFDLQNLGITVEAGLPNITGSVSGLGSWGSPISNKLGAFSNSSGSFQGLIKGGESNFYTNKLDLDASLSNEIYSKSNTVQQEAIQYPYFIQIATGQETENNIVNDIELNNPFSLFDSKYSDHELNNLSWLKSEGQWNSKAVYPTAYDELLREYNNPDRLATFNKDAFTVVGSPTITDDGVASGFSRSDYVTKNINLDPVNSTITIKGSFTLGAKNVDEEVWATNDLLFNLWHYHDTLSVRYNEYTTFLATSNLNLQDNETIKYQITLKSGNSSLKLYRGDILIRSTTSTIAFDSVITSFKIGRGHLSFLGSIDLKQFSITVDGKRVFSGAKSMVKLSTETYTDYDFVLNTSDETFRLPLKTKLASGKAVVGNGLTLGLTDGTTNFGLCGDNGGYGLGASASIYGQNAGTVNTNWLNLKGKSVGVTTDPTKSGIELSDSDLYLYFYVGETVQNANLIDAGRIGEQLANKADISTPSIQAPYLKTSYVNGTSGYRIWSDGYCEQWGVTTQMNATVTFLKIFADTNYIGNCVARDINGPVSAEGNPRFGAISTTQCFVCSGVGNIGSNWKACGYLAEGEY